VARYNKGLCKCGNLQTSAGKYKGRQVFSRYCHNCKNNKNRNYTKKSFCEKCGFIPEHPMQMDVDHIDGNHKNEDISNLQTLCANCHRLKTFLEKDYLNNLLKTDKT
jgi:5-methylcytosine-specific restriction endonuclease McrA